jgi:hypothetical protein
MSYFNERKSASTKVEVLQASVPRVFIEKEALTKMSVYVDECKEEIGWMGTATRDGRNITIHDVFLFEQDVHATTTEITPEGLSKFAEELLQQEDGMEVWNNLKMWGHSHVNMGITPSGQDNKQMETFKDGGHDWFIRLIANKKGEMKLDMYDYANSVIYTDLPWMALPSESELKIQDEIEKLYELLDTYEKARVDMHKEPIVAEMKEKVRKKVYSYAGSRAGNWARPQTAGASALTNPTTPTTGTTSGGKSTNSHTGTTDSKKKHEDSAGSYDERTNAIPEMADYFESDDEVMKDFTQEELVDLNQAKTLDELEDALWEMGKFMYFTTNDLERIFKVAYKVTESYPKRTIGR